MRLATSLLALFLCVPPAMATTPADYIPFSLDGNNDDQINNATHDMNGSLYLPSGYSSAQKYPVVMMIHGSGPSGFASQHINSADLDHLYERADSEGFVLFAPQAPTNNWGTTYSQRAVTLLDRLTQTYSIDTHRLYITGVSMGGGGLYNMVSANPGKFAAAVPIAGVAGGVSDSVLAQTPMWVFHNDGDQTVSVARSREKVNALLAIKGMPPLSWPLTGGSPYYSDSRAGYYQDSLLRYTEYHAPGHAVWPWTWDEDPLYDWMMAQSLPEPATAVVLAAPLLAFTRSRRDRPAEAVRD